MPGLSDVLARHLGRAPAPAEPPRMVLPPVPTSQDLLDAVARVEDVVTSGVASGAVPSLVAFRVRRIAATVRETVPRLGTLGGGSPQAHSVMATATNYLPEAIGGYLRLPRTWADTRPVEGGKTSLMVLCDQLDLLASTMDGIFDAVCRADAEALVAHGRFLAEKFGQSPGGGGLSVAPDPVPGATAPQRHDQGLEPPGEVS